MAIRGMADGEGDFKRWNVSARYVDDIDAKRPRHRFTATYAINPQLRVGVEVNPKSDHEKVGPLLNYLVWGEQGRRPALMVGTSSDRIGTPKGQAYFATLSKGFKKETGLPFSAYFGGSYGEFKNRLDPIGGINVHLTEMFSTSHLFDGVNIHHMLNVAVNEYSSLSLMVVEQKNDNEDPYFGISSGWRF